jgi:hypothetical protein
VQNSIGYACLSACSDFYLRWCDGEFIDAPPEKEILPLFKKEQLRKQLPERENHLGLRQVDVYAGLNVMILLLMLHAVAKTKDELKDKIIFRPCGEPDTEEFDSERLLRIIGYSKCLGAYAYIKILQVFLSGADLSGADLSGADLSGANLSGANLSGADLSGANLIGANLSGADLSGADLSGADLTCSRPQGSQPQWEPTSVKPTSLEPTSLEPTSVESQASFREPTSLELTSAKPTSPGLASLEPTSVEPILIGADLCGSQPQ